MFHTAGGLATGNVLIATLWQQARTPGTAPAVRRYRPDVFITRSIRRGFGESCPIRPAEVET
ncbi:hypothetical protein [Catenuloplanes indicus]|uniref:Uncharacterized protein n=1 Tax=Catenuloplanes indicus TaxID=137267 RepID=A0AAE3W193_9ACTN|nr:hypothetical protein [Catenuloplanes indicus]MDQ0366655.1 hypothetical protein [Catenuloplanes indicus]